MCIYPIIDDKKQLATGRPAATKSPFAIHHSYLTFLPLFFLFSSLCCSFTDELLLGQ